MSTETTIRVFSEFKERGLVALPGKRIVILWPDEVRRLAHPFRVFLQKGSA